MAPDEIEVLSPSEVSDRVRAGKLELIASKVFVRRTLWGNPVTQIIHDAASMAMKCEATTVAYFLSCDKYTWYGQYAAAEIKFYKKRVEPILRLRIVG